MVDKIDLEIEVQRRSQTQCFLEGGIHISAAAQCLGNWRIAVGLGENLGHFGVVSMSLTLGGNPGFYCFSRQVWTGAHNATANDSVGRAACKLKRVAA